MRIIISADTSFLLVDEFGDIRERTELGLYHEDTRYLSLYRLFINGQPLSSLTARATQSHVAAYFLTNPALDGIQRGTLSIAREHRLTDVLTEMLTVTNYGPDVAPFTLEFQIDADFAHVFDVKGNIEVNASRLRLSGFFGRELSSDGHELRFFSRREGRERLLKVRCSQSATLTKNRLRFGFQLAPGERTHLTLEFLPINPAEARDPDATLHAAEGARDRLAMVVHAPQLRTDGLVLQRGYAQSIRDIAALHIHDPNDGAGEYILAAGIPWFMTLFGRDSLITAYQVLPFFPDAAQGVLRALARQQGTIIDEQRMEEPGKILHEVRSPTFDVSGDHASIFPYYGTIDATPLFIMLLAAVFRVTGDLTFVRELRDHLLRALDWMDRYGDRDGDGFIEYLRITERGLENQGWKDAGDSMRFRDGCKAQPPIALAEVQGYAYAARLGAAELFDALDEPDQAAMQRATAAWLKERFNQAFWMLEREYFALALDGNKQQVDSITSNPGQLLWTGIVDDSKAEAIARQLVGPGLFAGWGVRTMAKGEGAYSPISYHNGTIWPHDNSLIINGLARYGFVREASLIAAGLLDALGYSTDGRLPELFAGFDREETGFPVEYPTACRPQAWSAGAILLILTAMTGFDASVPQLRAAPFLVRGITQVRLEGVTIHGQHTTLEVVREGDAIIARHNVLAPVRAEG